MLGSIEMLRRCCDISFLAIGMIVLLSSLLCSDNSGAMEREPVEIHDKLSSYQLFSNLEDHNGDLQPSEGGYHYELNTSLFSDYALKLRTLHLPAGERAIYREGEPFLFPIGTIVTKTFSFPEDFSDPSSAIRLIETRLLIRQPDGWMGVTYEWNDSQQVAERRLGGRSRQIVFQRDGATLTSNYTIPSETQCRDCHHVENENGERIMVAIGLKARHLNREDAQGRNQLLAMEEKGLLSNLPAPPAQWPRAVDADDESEELNSRARDYLDINCAHCHNPSATQGIISQFFLNHDNENLLNLGVCKKPGSAGPGGRDRTYDIVPGDGEQSILWYRMSIDRAGLMPPIARSLVHREGALLIKEWIDANEDFGGHSGCPE